GGGLDADLDLGRGLRARCLEIGPAGRHRTRARVDFRFVRVRFIRRHQLEPGELGNFRLLRQLPDRLVPGWMGILLGQDLDLVIDEPALALYLFLDLAALRPGLLQCVFLVSNRETVLLRTDQEREALSLLV